MYPLLFMVGLLLLVACSPDPCAFGDSLPSCAAKKSEVNATVMAINSDAAARERQAFMKATQDAIALRAQATQGAINSQATAVAVQMAATRGARSISAEGTRQAVELDSLRNSIVMSATQAALVLDTTKQAIAANATKTALDGETRIRQAEVQMSMAGVQQIILLAGTMSLFIAGVVGLIWYGRRLVRAGLHGVEVRASIVRYGPANSHWALVTPGKDGQKHVLLTDSMIGPHALSDGAMSTLQQLSVPDQVKLLALIEQEKRAKLVLAAQAVGSLPTSTVERVSEPLALPAASPIAAPIGDGALPAAPTFTQLITSRKPTITQLLLGFGAGGPIYGNMEDLLSIGVVGRPKTGKTTILRFIYAQCVLIGAQVVVWDMHRNIVKDLPGAHAYTQLEAIEHSAQLMTRQLRQRLEIEDYAARDLMILVDEFPLLSRVSATVVDVVGRIVLEGRKVHMYVMVAGQGFPANLFGGSLVRDAFNSRYVCHTSTKQAQMAGLDNESAAWVRNLPRGYAVLDGPVDPQIIAVPNTTREDVTALLPTSPAASRATSATAVTTSSAVNRSGREGAVEPAGEAVSEVDAVRRDRVRELLRNKVSASKIVREVWGVSGGDAYQRAAREYSEVVASIVAEVSA